MMAGLLGTVGRVSLSAAVMVLAVAALRLRFQDRTPRRAFCLLWDVVLVRLLVLAEIPSPVSVRLWLPALSGDRTNVPAMVSAVTPGTAVRMDHGVVQEAYVSSVMEDTAFSADVPVLQAAPALNWGAVLTALWLAGAAVLMVWLLWGHLRGRRVYAASLPLRDGFVLDWLAVHPLRRPVQVRTSDRIAAPLTYGVLYPVILLPAGMDRTDRQVLSCVLEHEYQHIRRFDALRKGLLAAALCLHWFNPLVWAMYILANRDIELACDEAVLRSGADREGYALALLGLEERRGRWSPSGSHFSQNALEERIKAIMKRKHISITALIAILVVMCITTTVFASAAPEDAPSELPHQNQNAPVTAYVETVKDDGVMMMSNGEDGEKLYSADGGETWMSEERYQAEYGSWGDGWQVEWWTYEEYKTWLEQEKKDLQEIIGSQGWTSSAGWFTWDQEKVDESIAMYEGILEDIKNGALYSKTIIDKDGNEIENAMLGSNAPLEMVIASTFDESNMVSAAPKALDKAALLEELKAFGIGGNEELMTYNGQPVRTFVDGAPVGDTGYSIQYVYINPDGVVDVHTLRSVIHNPDGSYDTMGDLIGVVSAGDNGFDQELIDSAAYSGGPEATITQDALADGGDDINKGRTFEEIFAQYEEYGLTYVPAAGSIGNLYYNGQLVNQFADLKPDGSAFSFSSVDGGELYLYAKYDQNGVFTGLETEVVPVRDISGEKRDLGFDYCAPVQGRLSAGFGQGRLSFHYGIDLAVEKGADIAAFAYGVVSEVGFDAQLGSYVVLEHTGGYSTLYGHCGNITVSEGSTVAMGEKIAEAGSSGMATGTVLHFELRDGAAYLDPAQYLNTAELT